MSDTTREAVERLIQQHPFMHHTHPLLCACSNCSIVNALRDLLDERDALQAQVAALKEKPADAFRPEWAEFGFASEAQYRLMLCLVRDFEYLREPTYGHTPLRHQHYWTVATVGLTDAQVKAAVAAILKHRDDDYEDTLLTLLGSVDRLRWVRLAAADEKMKSANA